MTAWKCTFRLSNMSPQVTEEGILIKYSSKKRQDGFINYPRWSILASMMPLVSNHSYDAHIFISNTLCIFLFSVCFFLFSFSTLIVDIFKHFYILNSWLDIPIHFGISFSHIYNVDHGAWKFHSGSHYVFLSFCCNEYVALKGRMTIHSIDCYNSNSVFLSAIVYCYLTVCMEGSLLVLCPPP